MMFKTINVHVSDVAGKRYRLCEYRLLYARPGEKPRTFQFNDFEVERFVKTLDLDRRELHYLVDGYYNHDVRRLSPADCEELLIQRIALGHLYVFPEQTDEDKQRKEPQGNGGARRQKRVKEAPAPNDGAAPSLGPHEEPGYQAAEEAPPANPPAQSLEECEQRLAAARERLKTEGYQPKYTDEELRAIAERGELDDRFVVRLMPSGFSGDGGHLGPKDGKGQIKYWSTTFNQAENADTDPETLAPLLGFTPDPDTEYTLVVVDTQAPGAGQSVTLVPTYDNMKKLSKSEIKGLDSELISEVMTPAYSEEYKKHMEVFEGRGLKVGEKKDRKRYAQQNISRTTDKERFETRATIHRKFGANQHFTGDGTTKNLLDVGGKRGAVESYTLDKNPKTLGDLERRGSAKRLSAKRL